MDSLAGRCKEAVIPSYSLSEKASIYILRNGIGAKVGQQLFVCRLYREYWENKKINLTFSLF